MKQINKNIPKEARLKAIELIPEYNRVLFLVEPKEKKRRVNTNRSTTLLIY